MIDFPLMNHFLENVETLGFAIARNAVDSETRAHLLAELRAANDEAATIRRAGRGAGLRDLLNVVPATRALAESSALRALVEPVLGAQARVVRGIFFDKTPEANWKVAWHQDLTIAVRRQIETPGFTAWSTKAGITHVQPPAPVLERMLTLRVHLDDANEENGALRVIPESHRHGRLTASEIEAWRERNTSVLCVVEQGGVMAMRPLLLHASSQASRPRHRRVLHFEYAAEKLPAGLEWYEN